MTVDAKTFDLRLVGYTPLGARTGIIPDLGFTIASSGSGPTLSAKVSTAVYGALPTNLEIGVEWWNAKTNAWQEGRDCRFAITQFDVDDRDITGTVTLTGVGIAAFLLAAASLNSVTPYTATNVRSEAAATSSTVSVSGTTFTWNTHILAAGDRVKVTAVGNAKGLTSGSVYYVQNPTTNTFQLSATPTGAVKSCGTASNVSMSRVCTRIVFNSGSHSFNRSESVRVTGGSAIGLRDTTDYYVVNPTPATIQLASEPGGIPVELSPANTTFTDVHRNLDGQRVFTNATPGTVMDAVFLEARSRGWGVGQDGTTMMQRGWSTTADSIGNAWATLANDPATPGVGLSFQPGTPGTQVLQALLDNQYAEWFASGRTVHLVNYGTGADKTTDTTSYAAQATASPVPEISITPGTIGSVMQDFVRVPSTGHWFVTQVVTESNGFESTRISRLNSSGTLIDQMIANGGGHGTSIDIEVISGVEYVWLTWARADNVTGTAVDNNVVRFPWPTGLTTTATRFNRSAVTGLVTKIAGAGTYRNVQFDWLNSLVLIRLSSGTTDTYQLHSLSNIQAGNVSSPQSTISLKQSANFGLDGYPTVQGFATYKNSFFRYSGSPSDKTGGDPFMLYEYRWSDGVQVRALNLSGLDKTNGVFPGGKGEPEGMVLYDADGTAPKVYIGINTGPTGGPHGYDLFSMSLLPTTVATTSGGTPVRIGTTASAVKVQTDLTDLRTAVTVRGEGNILQTATATAGPWGRLESYESASGLTSNSLASDLATNDLAAASNPTAAYTVTELAQAAAYVPLADYSRGDWISVQLAGGGWVTLRCQGWQFQKDDNGVVTVTTNLARIKKGLIAKLAAAATKQTAGLSQTATGQTLLESDNRKASVPLGVTATSSGVFAKDGAAAATITASWLPVTADINGGDLSIDDYEVWIRPEGATRGQPVGRTHGLTLDAGPYPSNKVYGVSIRARSSTGQWGELSAEVEVTTAFPSTVPNPPTAPTVSGKLGAIRVAWDGLLVDPTLGNIAPENGFAYVYAAYSTTVGGTYIPAGSNMGNAGYTPITGLSIGSTYFFALFAVNTLGVVSPSSVVVSLTVVGVTGPDIQANSVTANSIAAGAITAEKLDVGTVPQGNPINRVPQPLFVTSYWSGVVAGTTLGFSFAQGTATTTGLGLAAGGASGLRQSLTVAKVPAPASGAINLKVGLTSTASVTVYVRTWDSTGHDNGAVAVPASGIYTLPATAQTYEVFVNNTSTTTATTITSASVFEVIGSAATGEAAQLSPSGLRLYDNTGHLALDLTTASQQFLNIYDNTGADPQSVASVDSAGNANFAWISGDGYDVNGQWFTDETSAYSLSRSMPNNASFGAVPLLDRLARGVIYDVTWPTLNTTAATGTNGGTNVTTQYQRIAQDQFTLEDGRSYMFVLENGGLQVDSNNAGRTIYLELQFNTVPNTSVTSGSTVMRAMVPSTQGGYWALPPIVYTASSATSTIDQANRLVPAGVPVYWQLDLNLSAAPSATYNIKEWGGSRGFTVIDVGSSFPVRQVWSGGSLSSVADTSTTGGSSGTSSTGTTATSTTTTYTASWSRTWNQSGSSIVTGTGQYTNGAAMYQGYGASPMGSKFGFAALGLSGKTITDMQLYLYASYFAYSGKSALLGTHGDAAAPATYTGARANAWSAGWSGGSGKWVSVPSSLWAGFAAGTYRGFTLGVDAADANYAYFRGATQANPPQIKLTYH